MSRRKLTAVLGMPTKVPDIIMKIQFFIRCLTGNVWFPNPLPSIADLTAHVATLIATEAAVMAGEIDAIGARNNALKTIIQDGDDYLNMVQTAADADLAHAAEIILSAGLTIKGKGGKDPQVYSATSEVQGMVKLTAPVPDGRFAIVWFKSIDNVNWDFAGVAYYATMELDNLTPDALYYFKYAMNIDRVQQGFSTVIECRIKK